jgi:multidrug efflux pump
VLHAAVRPEGLEDAPQLQIDIDRDKASALGVDFAAINQRRCPPRWARPTSTTSPTPGRLQRVVVQADATGAHAARGPAAHQRGQRTGQPVPLSAFASTRWVTGQMQTGALQRLPHRCGSGGSGSPGYSTGDAMAEMERLAAQLPPGFAFEWTGLSREERLCRGRRPLILLAFSLLAVFLCLAALYESWSIPLAVILVVPLGVLGVLLASPARAAQRRLLQGRPDHHHRPVGQERGADHRVRQGPAGPGQDRRDRGRAGGRAPALPPDRDDLDGLHPGRAAAGHRQRAPARPASAPSAPA